MALVKTLEELRMERNTVHEPVSATYSIFKGTDGETYVQIDTYGSSHRAILGNKSQSLQLNREAQIQLRDLLTTILR